MEVLAGPNYITCVSFEPFVLDSLAVAKDDEENAFDFLMDSLTAGEHTELDDVITSVSPDAVTARSYGKPSAELSSLGFETMFTIKCLAKKLEIPRLEEPTIVYVATRWGLLSKSRYTLKYHFTSVAAAEVTSAPPKQWQTHFVTKELLNIFRSKELDAQFVPDAAVLQRSDVVDLLNAQGEEGMMLMWPPDPTNLASLAEAVRFLFYNGLFLLPQSIHTHAAVLWLLQVPNGAQRYVLDFARQRQTPGAESSSVSMFPWRRHSKVRRLIHEAQSGKYIVAVRDTKEAIAQSLKRAEAYHTQHNGSTWLSEPLIDLLATTADTCRYENTDTVTYGTPGLRLLCVELVEQQTGKVLAGCCGFACGAVYHDYTMYTLERGNQGFGTFLTKLLGEALQKCGYEMWYWGFRLGYMEDYTNRYGGTDMSRPAFYERWCAARERAPSSEFVWDFLRAGRGMIPHFDASAPAPTVAGP